MATTPKSKQEPARKSNTLKVELDGKKSRERLEAEAFLAPTFANTFTATTYSRDVFAEPIDLMEAIGVTGGKVRAVASGDLSGVEAMLVAQAQALDAIFNGLAIRAKKNMGQHLGAADTYLRLALKAQSQCRTTLETLAEIKYPKAATFIRQQNIANQQQVNNGVEAGSRSSTRPDTRVEKVDPSIELLSEGKSASLDTAGAGAAGGADSRVEALAEIHRPQD